MENRNKIKDIFKYLLQIKRLSNKIVRNVSDYDKSYWESDLNHMGGCFISKDGTKEWWLKVNKKAKGIYDQFFKILLDTEKNGEKTEILWGHGLFGWSTGEQKIIHPFLITRMEITFDEKLDALLLTPIGKTIMETNFLRNINEFPMDELINIEKEFNFKCLDPRKFDEISPVFEEIMKKCSTSNFKISYKDNFAGVNKINVTENPYIYNSPIIIVRKNNINFWESELEETIKYIDGSLEIPKPVEALAEEQEILQSEYDRGQWNEVKKNILFPLPSNEEQREIVRRLCDNYGVVVEGPPGTGKSHTIANLICHLLAHGKRVLVTSETDRALKVLSHMIPKEIRPLCMNVTSNETGSIENMDLCVRQIVDNLSVDGESLYNDIKNLEEELKENKKQQRELEEKLRSYSKAESSDISINGKNHKMADVIKWLKDNEDEYCYIKDQININQMSPLSNEEFNRIVELLTFLGKDDIKQINLMKPLLDKLPSYEEISHKMQNLNRLTAEEDKFRENLIGWQIPKNTKCNLDSLYESASNAIECLNKFENCGMGGLVRLFRKSKIIRDNVRNFLYKCNSNLLKISRLNEETGKHLIEIPNQVPLEKFIDDFDKVYDEFMSKGHIGVIFKAINRSCMYILKDCKVDMEDICTVDQIIAVRLYLERKEIEQQLICTWNLFVSQYDMEKIKVNSDRPIIKIEQYIENISVLCNWDNDVKNDILDRLHDIMIPENLNWYSADTFNKIIKAVNSIKSLDENENLKAYFIVLKKLIMSIRGLEELYTAIETNDLNKIKTCYDNIERLRIRKGDVTELNNFLEKLKKSCPKLTEELLNTNDYRKYKHFNKAWQWKQLNCYINKINSIDNEALINEYKQKKSLESFIINSLIGKKTWLNQIKIISKTEQRKLISWMEAVKRIGNGKGKLVTTYRRIAQREMENCRNIIPVWIMPFNKVIENFKLSKEKFDVVIFDESSQSDIFSICALMRAKKAVIVGDDKQIGPENIGIEEISVNRLIKEYLNEIPQAQWFDLRTSLYDTALRVFPNRLMLKEHFRSVPEIIQFSNNFYYNKSIIPLRKVSSNNFLNPPVVAVKVENALRSEKKSVNIKEAAELVEKVVECCNNKNYSGMSMGVISLLGDDQSQLIEDLLRNRLGEKEVLRRKLICGDAYSFQGDERDVMFLSMVAANNMKFAPLTKESDRRRFNVAGSRARNQMWVFHSIDLKDLNPNCARYALLKYCENYGEYKYEFNLNYIFKYQLQREIYNRIKEMGYKIIPQIKIGVYNIDFIIEGECNRAAVICEGDKDNNIDIVNALLQQINLERIGWNFIRIKASEYYLNKEDALEKVCEKLNELGIERCTNNEPVSRLQII